MQTAESKVKVYICFPLHSDLLLNNYNFLQDISLCPELVAIGIFASTLSAALSALIGASRVLIALANDNLFGECSSILQSFPKIRWWYINVNQTTVGNKHLKHPSRRSLNNYIREFCLCLLSVRKFSTGIS